MTWLAYDNIQVLNKKRSKKGKENDYSNIEFKEEKRKRTLTFGLEFDLFYFSTY